MVILGFVKGETIFMKGILNVYSQTAKRYQKVVVTY